MTLRVRLAAMMVTILVAVLTLQYLLMERDRQETMSRLTELGSGLDRSTALFVEEVHDLSRRPREDGLSSLLQRLTGPESFSTEMQVTLVLWSDSTQPAVGETDRLESLRVEWFEERFDSLGRGPKPGPIQGSPQGPSHGLPPDPRPGPSADPLQGTRRLPLLPGGEGRRDSLIVEAYADRERRIIVQSLVGSDSLTRAVAGSLLARTWSRAESVIEDDRPAAPSGDGPSPRDTAAPAGPPAPGSRTIYRAVVPSERALFAGRKPLGGGHDVVVNLPLPAAASDSFASVQVRYPLDAIQEELSNQRKRSLLWLGSVLGIGVLGAFVVAGQFTRPIRALQASFRRVEQGDLSVRVEPRRADEIGQLTGSFNEMVDRLRESREVESRLGEAERLATLGRLAAGVAHEVRNPLNAIQLTALQMRDVARRGRDAVDPVGLQLDRYYQLVSGEVQRLERLVSAFLDLTRDDELTKVALDGVQSLAASVELFRPEARARDIQIEFEADGACSILADTTRLPAVWNNLLSNALTATPNGGVVRVRATAGVARSPGDGETAGNATGPHDGFISEATGPGPGPGGCADAVPERASPAGAEFVVVVSDSGPGIAEADRSLIWEPFFSGRAAGTGLGLSIVRAVVERHRGSVRLLESEGGAVFEVRVPCMPGYRPQREHTVRTAEKD